MFKNIIEKLKQCYRIYHYYVENVVKVIIGKDTNYSSVLVTTTTIVLSLSCLIAIGAILEFRRQVYIQENYGDKIEEKMKSGDISLPNYSREKLSEKLNGAFGLFEQEIYNGSIEITSDCKNSIECHAIALYKHITENFKTVENGKITESTLKLPLETWRDKTGTTEDLSILFGSMLYGLGHDPIITYTPLEAFITIYNFNENKIVEEIIRRYKTNYGLIKHTKIDLKPKERHQIKIEVDSRYHPLVFEITGTSIFDIKFYKTQDEYRRFRDGTNQLTNNDIDRFGITSFQKELYLEKGSIILVENGDNPSMVTYMGYRINDEETHNYIKGLIKIYKSDGTPYNCHMPFLFSLGENVLPGRENKLVTNVRVSGGAINIPASVLARRFLRQTQKALATH